MENKLEHISNNIKAYRIRKGLTQEEAAEQLNVSRATYIDYETKPGKVKIDTLKKIANLYKCELKDFFLEI